MSTEMGSEVFPAGAADEALGDVTPSSVDRPSRVFRALGWFVWLLAWVGTAISAYLTVEHYSQTVTLACPATGTVNCEKVTSSSFSEFAGVPIVWFGLGFFLTLLVLCSPWLWRSSSMLLRGARAAILLGGVGFVFYLVYAELFRIHAICLWCTAVHAITVVMFVCVVFAEAFRTPLEQIAVDDDDDFFDDPDAFG